MGKRGRPRKYPKALPDASCILSSTGFHVTVYGPQINGEVVGKCRYCAKKHIAKEQNLPWSDNLLLSASKTTGDYYGTDDETTEFHGY